METRRLRKRASAPEHPASGSGGSSPAWSSSSSSSSSSSFFSSSSAAPAPFRGPAADSVLGERLLDVLPIVAAMGFAAEVAHCLYLCGETFRRGDRGATNDMLVRSLERQCGARAARAAAREDFVTGEGNMVRGSTQLMRAAMLNNLPRVLQLVQLGAPLELTDEDTGRSALRWACRLGHEHVARALLDGKFEGRGGAGVDARRSSHEWTPLMEASCFGREGAVRLLLARGARQGLEAGAFWSALRLAVQFDSAAAVALLCAAPGAAAALALRRAGVSPLGLAVLRGHAACEAALRAHGAEL
jgi:hypothetical protein